MLLAKAQRVVYIDDMNQLSSSLKAGVPKLPVDATDAEFDAWMERLLPAPGIRSIDDDNSAADAASIAEFKAGGGVPHEIVSEWLKTWGAEDYRPFWEWYAARDD